MLSPQEIEKIRAAAGAGPILSQATTSLSSKLGLQKPTEETKTPSLKDRFNNAAGTAADVAIGVAKSIPGSVGGTAELLSKAENYVQNKAIELAGTIKGATPEDVEAYKQEIKLPETQQAKKESAESISEMGKPENTAQEIGKGIGDVVQFAAVPTSRGSAVTKFATNLATGAGVSAVQGGDTTENITSGVINAVIPGVGPVLKKVGTGIKETLGATTGVGGGVINKAWEAAKAGGKQLEAFKQGLGTSAEAIVNEAGEALDKVISNRNVGYKAQLEKIKDIKGSYDISPIKNKFNTMLDDFNVFTNKKTGELDFTRSPGLGRYAEDLKNMKNTIESWGTVAGDRTIAGVDKLKQVIDDYRIGSKDSKKFDAFVTGLRDTAKGLIKNSEYDKLVDDYSNSTGLIKEIQKGLSLNDSAMVETSFKKLTTALRTNNESRKALIEELDNASGGFLSSKIAGQQMSELLPRGITARLGTAGALGFAGFAQAIPALIFASPKSVQLMLRAVGLPAKYTKPFFDAIAKNQSVVSGITQEGVRSTLDNPETGN